ncbi:MAG TPA: Spy/CpxP family protein refolding chaperone [Alphaproteobacteria bacterium]|nr:Spy/CpxP family protein refolding chaperone [Alphaproteobacteria bacterium]
MFNLSPRLSSALTAAAILGAVLFIPPSAAMAQASPAPAPAAKATPANDPLEARIKSLHKALQITAAQEPQWQAVADVMRANAETIVALMEERAAKAKTMTAIDDLNSYEAMADAHAAGVKKLVAAFETLYASLSDAQKKKADAEFRHRQPVRPKTTG